MDHARRWSRRVGAALAASALLFAPLGCGGTDNLPREAVSGTVEFEGKPLAKGQIQFMPSATSATPITGGAAISGGKFSIPKAEGLVPGEYTVSISSEGDPPSKKSAAEKAAPGEMPGLGPLHAAELIPAKYNATSTLKSEVKQGGPNNFEYKLTK